MYQCNTLSPSWSLLQRLRSGRKVGGSTLKMGEETPSALNKAFEFEKLYVFIHTSRL